MSAKMTDLELLNKRIEMLQSELSAIAEKLIKHEKELSDIFTSSQDELSKIKVELVFNKKKSKFPLILTLALEALEIRAKKLRTNVENRLSFLLSKSLPQTLKPVEDIANEQSAALFIEAEKSLEKPLRLQRSMSKLSLKLSNKGSQKTKKSKSVKTRSTSRKEEDSRNNESEKRLRCRYQTLTQSYKNAVKEANRECWIAETLYTSNSNASQTSHVSHTSNTSNSSYFPSINSSGLSNPHQRTASKGEGLKANIKANVLDSNIPPINGTTNGPAVNGSAINGSTNGPAAIDGLINGSNRRAKILEMMEKNRRNYLSSIDLVANKKLIQKQNTEKDEPHNNKEGHKKR